MGLQGTIRKALTRNLGATTLVVATAIVLGGYIIKINSSRRRWPLVNVTSMVDGRTYSVRDTSEKQLAADTLAKINQRILRLIGFLLRHLQAYSPYFQSCIALISERYVPGKTILSEGDMDAANQTTYTVNKGEAIVFCLTPRGLPGGMTSGGGAGVYDLNLLTFVALHELAHIGCRYRDNHGPEFQKVFKFLLTEANKFGLYSPIDFQRNPVNYCSVDITASP